MSEEDDNHRKKRSLILAGGGIKVAFQAGVLQVWLDEAGLTFDHADGGERRYLQPRDVLPGDERRPDRRQLAEPLAAPRRRLQP